MSAPGKGSYKVTPKGREAVAEKMSGLDLVALIAEGATSNAPVLGQTTTALVSFTLAPPQLVGPLPTRPAHRRYG